MSQTSLPAGHHHPVHAQVQGGHSTANTPASQEIEGFSHMVLEVKDLDRSENFYRDVIGLDLMGRALLAEDRPHSLLRMNTGQLIVLVQVAKPEPMRANTSTIHHAFLLTVDQFRQAQERFKAAGYDIGDTRDAFRAKGEFSMDIFDPDGHRWQVQAFGEEQHSLIRPGVGVVDCGPWQKYAIGSVTSFGKEQFFLIRSKAGFLALSRWCRHANGLLSYQCEHWRFFCAFHGATYNLEGDHTGHLADIPPLRMNPVTIGKDGHVLVDTDVVVERGPDSPPQYISAPEPALASR